MKSRVLLLTFFVCSYLSVFAQSDTKDVVIKLADGNRYTNQSSVTVDLEYQDAVSMQLSSTSDFTMEKWVAFKSHLISYPLSAGQGKKTVYVRFKTSSGEISPVYSDDITVDTEKPTDISIEVDIEGEYVKDPSLEVVVLVSAKGAKYMQLSNSRQFNNKKWMLYKEDVDWKLAEGPDGPREIFIRFTDVAQNDTKIISTKVYIDREPPVRGSVVINRGDKYSIQQDKKVDLTIGARGANFMQISTDNTFKDVEWVPFATSYEYQLDDADGEKTVYVRFKDNAGNTTPVSSDNIIIDTTAPKDCQIEIDGGVSATSDINKMVSLSLQATADTKFMMISNSTGFYGAKWILYKPNMSWKLAGEEDGEKAVYVKFRDEAGNVSSVFSDKIILQRDF